MAMLSIDNFVAPSKTPTLASGNKIKRSVVLRSQATQKALQKAQEVSNSPLFEIIMNFLPWLGALAKAVGIRSKLPDFASYLGILVNGYSEWKRKGVMPAAWKVINQTFFSQVAPNMLLERVKGFAARKMPFLRTDIMQKAIGILTIVILQKASEFFNTKVKNVILGKFGLA